MIWSFYETPWKIRVSCVALCLAVEFKNQRYHNMLQEVLKNFTCTLTTST